MPLTCLIRVAFSSCNAINVFEIMSNAARASGARASLADTPPTSSDEEPYASIAAPSALVVSGGTVGGWSTMARYTRSVSDGQYRVSMVKETRGKALQSLFNGQSSIAALGQSLGRPCRTEMRDVRRRCDVSHGRQAARQRSRRTVRLKLVASSRGERKQQSQCAYRNCIVQSVIIVGISYYPASAYV